MSGAIQARGADVVCQMFKNRNCNAFSIWQRSQFLYPFVGESPDEAVTALGEYLDILAEASTNAIYTIKVYEDFPATDKIKNKTPDDGSFNFRLDGDAQQITNAQYSRLGGIGELSQRLAAIEAAINSPEEKEKEPSALEKIGEYIEHNSWTHPIVTNVINAVIKQIPGFNIPGMQIPPVALAGTDDAAISAALEKLKAKDPALASHLTKLANLPDEVLKQLLGMLDQM